MRDSYLKKVLGDSYSDIQNATVLMVGAGGIGCELLKNLVLSGFKNVHVVDLDSITLSNLNRQFLFRHSDIDKLKLLTIKQAVQKFNYHNTRVTLHHGNIMDAEQFPTSFWAQFTCIYNALDNLEARRYVNRMALFNAIPVMESGTTGFDGYVQPIYPYKTECFDCQPKATPQVFPVCTIRSTPLKPIHCITWAKEFLFQQLLGEAAAEELATSSESQINMATDDVKEREALLKEHNELLDLRLLLWKDLTQEFFSKMVSKLWVSDIERLLLIDALWTNRTKPELLNTLEPASYAVTDDQTIWTVLETLRVLYDATKLLQKRLPTEKSIEFDKDDEDTLNFVVAAANLRSYVFHIDLLTKFDCKQIAGNIIPAIATTNAIISGFLALESLNFFQQSTNRVADSSMVFISIRPNKYVTPALLEPPRSSCASCSIARGVAKLASSITIQQLVDAVTEKYGYSGDITFITGQLKLLFDYDFTDNLEKSIELLGLAKGLLLLVQDVEEEFQDLELYIDEGSGLELPTVVLGAFKEKEIDTGADSAAENGNAAAGDELTEVSNSDDIIIVDDIDKEDEGDGKVGGHEIEGVEVQKAEEEGPALKRQKV